MFEQTIKAIQLIKNQNPLILNITNYVTMDFVANGLLSLGASPIMSHAEEEIEDLLQLTKAVVINLGTLDEKFISLCKKTCKLANQLAIPIILDPVGSGASRYRTETSLSLINDFHFAMIRGNASEIMSLANQSYTTKGVDTVMTTDAAIEYAQSLSHQFNSTMIISGKTDVIIDKELLTRLSVGSQLMPFVTGSGCLLTAIIAAFHSVHNNKFEAATMATLFYGLASE